MPIRAFSVHGHFYQPPREDPVTGLIPREAGAYPYNNWNERIHAECYRPNAEAGNFARMSFNVGPTLFEWMEGYDRETYQSILAQDQEALKRYGVGNAIAQSYNHTILPLASLDDKNIQVAWGIADFEHRFGRRPQGMWLPETAVDLETLDVMARHGIEFTILAPWQAAGGHVDSSEPYRVQLPDNRSITVFFYQKDLSARISFDANATSNADLFAHHSLNPLFQPEKTQRGEPQLIMLASDGELYGHHKKFRERFLSHLLDGASSHLGLTPVYPGLWLKNYPPRASIQIADNTSWSCHHGVTRWSGVCDCTQEGEWKVELRKTLNRMAAALDGIYFETVYRWVSKPRLLRKRFIYVQLGKINAEELINHMAEKTLKSDEMQRVQLLLQAQLQRQRMFTSCGWFFEDFDRIEPKNNISYAAQAVRLTAIATGLDITPQVLPDLQKIVSPRTKLRGDQVFQQQIERTIPSRRFGV